MYPESPMLQFLAYHLPVNASIVTQLPLFGSPMFNTKKTTTYISIIADYIYKKSSFSSDTGFATQCVRLTFYLVYVTTIESIVWSVCLYS